MIYLITYNINTLARDYAPFYEAIKGGCDSYFHAQESSWFVACRRKQNVSRMAAFLKTYLYSGDTIFVAELRPDNEVQGWLTMEFWDWYKQNINYD